MDFALELKVLSLLGIFSLSILFGVAPLYLKKCALSHKTQWINNTIICFSGGTLLGITFLHLMPETRESVRFLTAKGKLRSFPSEIPVADIIICCGFFFVYILDETVHWFLECMGADNAHEPQERQPPVEESYSYYPEMRGGNGLNSGPPPGLTKNVSVMKHSIELTDTSMSITRPDDVGRLRMPSEEKTDNPVTPQRSRYIVQLDKATSTEPDFLKRFSPPENSHYIHIPSLLTILAMSFHDLFEGLVLGIQDQVIGVLLLFLSVATHKYAITFAVSLDLLLNGFSNQIVVLYTVCFSVVNPLGVAIGIAMSLLNDQKSVESTMTVILQGVASGALIYVTCFEVLQRHRIGENKRRVTGLRNTIFVILGFVFILFMKVALIPHSHGFEKIHEEYLVENSQ